MSKDIKIGKGVYRFELNNFTLLYEKNTDELNIGFKNADKLTKKDLEDIYYLTDKLLTTLEHEER